MPKLPPQVSSINPDPGHSGSASPVRRRPLNVLLLEDQEADAELILLELRRAGFQVTWRRVDTEADFLTALNTPPEIILADFNLNGFDAIRALELVAGRAVDVPLIVVSGSIGEETAIALLKHGAADYLLKDRLARLGPSIQRALSEQALRIEKAEADRVLRETQDRMAFALEAARVGTWEADLTTGRVRWSPVLEQLHGLSMGEFSGTVNAFLEQVHPDDRPKVASAMDEITRRGGDSNIVYRNVWPDGSVHWQAGIGRTLYDQEGRAVRAAGIGMDVTERLALEEQYRQAQKMEAVGQLAGGIAHDFNNLLTAIQGYGELLVDEVGGNTQALADIHEVLRAVERATTLTRQLLMFSRRQAIETKVIDLRETLSGIEPMLRRLIREDIEIVVKKSDQPSTVKADPGQVEQIILNLVVNARDAMPDGGKLLIETGTASLDQTYVHQHPGAEPGDYIMLAVTDTGTGMDASTRARIFEPFFTTKQKGKGTGLGLATVHGIVKQCGGDIWVYSEPGHGTTFKVYLPFLDMLPDAAPSRAAAESLEGSGTILVVEDEDGVRHLVQRVLERYGYRVLTAATPHEALRLARSERGIQLLMSDVILPAMSGPEVAEQVLSIHPGIRVLYMSGYTDEAIANRGLLTEGTQFLEKPFTPETLAKKVRQVLN
jgi:two-component system cell cycle sensor histidine kinase/response regulator CckA